MPTLEQFRWRRAARLGGTHKAAGDCDIRVPERCRSRRADNGPIHEGGKNEKFRFLAHRCLHPARGTTADDGVQSAASRLHRSAGQQRHMHPLPPGSIYRERGGQFSHNLHAGRRDATYNGYGERYFTSWYSFSVGVRDDGASRCIHHSSGQLHGNPHHRCYSGRHGSGRGECLDRNWPKYLELQLDTSDNQCGQR